MVMTRDRIAAASERLSARVEQDFIASGRLPHAQILIARDGEVLHRSVHGAARADGTPLSDDALFRIASMTKPVTATAFMMLVEEGRVRLDDPVSAVIPEFEGLVRFQSEGDSGFRTAPCAPMRMIDLLRHTSGLTYGFLNRTPVDAAYRAAAILAPGSDRDADGFIEALRGLPLEFEPGGRWNYSVSTDVLGVVVERIEGRPLGDVFADRIFEPLGMVDTGFHCPDDKSARLTDAWFHHPTAGRVLAEPADTSRWRQTPAFASGGGGLLSTVDDYHRFCTMLVNGGSVGKTSILSTDSIAAMTRNQLPDGRDLASMSPFAFPETGAAGTGFGLGFAVTLNPEATGLPGSVGDFYWSGIYSTAFFVDPIERLHAIFMTQLLPTGAQPVRQLLRQAAYDFIR